jgi:hypothetical protein
MRQRYVDCAAAYDDRLLGALQITVAWARNVARPHRADRADQRRSAADEIGDPVAGIGACCPARSPVAAPAISHSDLLVTRAGAGNATRLALTHLRIDV